MPGQVAAAVAAHRMWLANVAAAQLASAARGDFGRARALQANIPFTRPYTLAVRTRIADLQAQITRAQGTSLPASSARRAVCSPPGWPRAHCWPC